MPFGYPARQLVPTSRQKSTKKFKMIKRSRYMPNLAPPSVLIGPSIPSSQRKVGRNLGHPQTQNQPADAASPFPSQIGPKKRQLKRSAAVCVCRLFFGTDDIFDILLRLMPRGHQFMAAAQALQTEVRTGTQDLPLLFAAGMGLLHHKDVTQLNIQKSHSFLMASQ